MDFVLDGLGLVRGLDGVELGAEAGGLLAVVGDLALEAGAQRFFAAEGGRGLGSLALGCRQGGFGLGELGGQGARLLSRGGRVPNRRLAALRGFQSALASVPRRIRHLGCNQKMGRDRVLRQLKHERRGELDGDASRILAQAPVAEVGRRRCCWRRWRRWPALVLVLAHRAEPMLRARIVAGLEEHFHARVELDSFHLSLRGGLWAEGKGLRIWPPAQVAGVAVPGSAARPVGAADPAGGVPVSCAARLQAGQADSDFGGAN